MKSGLETLCNAVILKGCEDYIKARLMQEKSRHLVKECRDFFTGEMFDLYNAEDMNGDELLRLSELIITRKMNSWKKKHEKEMAE